MFFSYQMFITTIKPQLLGNGMITCYSVNLLSVWAAFSCRHDPQVLCRNCCIVLLISPHDALHKQIQGIQDKPQLIHRPVNRPVNRSGDDSLIPQCILFRQIAKKMTTKHTTEDQKRLQCSFIF